VWLEVQDLYRQASPEAAKEIIRLATECQDERVRSVCANWVIERAWGKPKEYDPYAAQKDQKPKFDPSLYTHEELPQLYAALEMMAKRQGLLPDDK
jgi:hypothetical protein